MLSKTFSDFILDIGVTDHTDTMIDNIENKIESSSSGMVFKK